jgi:hypothetical protein
MLKGFIVFAYSICPTPFSKGSFVCFEEANPLLLFDDSIAGVKTSFSNASLKLHNATEP